MWSVLSVRGTRRRAAPLAPTGRRDTKAGSTASMSWRGGDDRTWIVELKGAGLSHSAGYQVHFHGVLGQILRRMRKTDPNTRYAIGLPSERNYTRLLRSFSSSRAISALDLHLILLFREGSSFVIAVFNPTEFSDLSWEHYIH